MMAWCLFPVLHDICYVFFCTVVNVAFRTHAHIYIHLTNIHLQNKLISYNDVMPNEKISLTVPHETNTYQPYISTHFTLKLVKHKETIIFYCNWLQPTPTNPLKSCRQCEEILRTYFLCLRNKWIWFPWEADGQLTFPMQFSEKRKWTCSTNHTLLESYHSKYGDMMGESWNSGMNRCGYC